MDLDNLLDSLDKEQFGARQFPRHNSSGCHPECCVTVGCYLASPSEYYRHRSICFIDQLRCKHGGFSFHSWENAPLDSMLDYPHRHCLDCSRTMRLSTALWRGQVRKVPTVIIMKPRSTSQYPAPNCGGKLKV